MTGGSTLSPRKKKPSGHLIFFLLSSVSHVFVLCTDWLKIICQSQFSYRSIPDWFVVPFSRVWVAVTLRTESRFWSASTQKLPSGLFSVSPPEWHVIRFLIFYLRYKRQSPYGQNPDSGLLPLKTYLQFSFSVTIWPIPEWLAVPCPQVWVAVTLRTGPGFRSASAEGPRVHCTHPWLQAVCGLHRWAIHCPWWWGWDCCCWEGKVSFVGKNAGIHVVMDERNFCFFGRI